MVDKSAIEYIRSELKAGKSREDIGRTMMAGGWAINDVNKAFTELDAPAAPAPVVPPPPVVPPAPIARPTSPVAVPVSAPMQPVPQVAAPAKHRHWLTYSFAVIGVFVLLAGGTVAYAFTAQKFAFLPPLPFSIPLPFLSSAPYDSTHLLQGVAAGFTKINSSAFEVALDVKAEPRDKDAQPYTVEDQTGKMYLQALSARIPSDFDLQLSFGGATQNKDGNINVAISAAGSLHTTDFSMDAAVDARRVGQDLYILVKKFPSVFFDVTAIRDKWIRISAQDQKNQGAGAAFLAATSTEEQQAKAREQLTTMLQLADDSNAFLVVGAAKQESLEGVTVYHYTLKINPDGMVVFYEKGMEAFKDDPKIGFSQSSLDYLKSAEGQRALQYLADNMTFEIWADQAGVPHKLGWYLRMVPDDSVVRMKDRQVRVSLELTLRNINAPADIVAPDSSMSLDDAEKLLFGTTPAR